MRLRTASLAGLLLTLLLLPQAALASVPAAEHTVGESNLPFLLAGAVLVWLGFFGYAFYTGKRNGEMRREIDEIRFELAERDRESG
jgi:ammonia channel protein AmtB